MTLAVQAAQSPLISMPANSVQDLQNGVEDIAKQVVSRRMTLDEAAKVVYARAQQLRDDPIANKLSACHLTIIISTLESASDALARRGVLSGKIEEDMQFYVKELGKIAKLGLF